MRHPLQSWSLGFVIGCYQDMGDYSSGLMTLAFAIHLAATWMLVGLIWVIQILVYPQFRRVPEPEFAGYHMAHCFRIGLIVGPLIFLEAGSAGWLLYQGHRELPFVISIGLMVQVWASTAFFQAPMHTGLMNGFSGRTITRLIQTNWLRTISWTVRAVLVTSVLLN